jgi:hypothetical protein
MASVTLCIVDFAASGLLLVETELGIGFAALDIASKEREENQRNGHYFEGEIGTNVF